MPKTIFHRCLHVAMLLLAATQVFSQHLPDTDQIGDLILEKVNHYRDSLQLHLLKDNQILQLAAKDQSDYMLAHGQLTHKQETYNKQSPSERVFFYGGNFNYIGENVALVSAQNSNGTWRSPEAIATDFFNSWINSPGHRANITGENYYQSGIAFSYNPKNGKMYATHVFSAPGYTFQKRLTTPPKAYGIQTRDSVICHGAKNFRYGQLLMANGIYVQRDSVFLYYHDMEYFRKIIDGPNDGYAVDIVFRDQLPCGGPNLFHGSDIFDGSLLPPVFQYEIYSNNMSQNPAKLNAYLGKLPAGLPPYELNIVLIKDNYACDYSYPVDVPYRHIPPMYIKPLIIDPAIDVPAIEIRDTLVFNFPFERGSVDLDANTGVSINQELMYYYGLIEKIRIEAFSSVEGKEWYNIALQEKRAEKIRTLLSFWPDSIIEISAIENWEMMDAQISRYSLSELANKNRMEIKSILAKDVSHQYDSLLYEQRRSSATVYLSGSIDLSEPATGGWASWHHALATNHVGLAAKSLCNAVLNESYIYTGIYGTIPDHFFTDTVFLVNFAANWINSGHREKMGQLDSIDPGTLDPNDGREGKLLLNWINLYHHTLYGMSVSYFSDPKKNRPMIEPEIIEELLMEIDSTEFADTTYLNKLKINHHLSAIYYYGYINNWPKLQKSFETIFYYFFRSDLSVEEATALALFSNAYFHFDRTVEMLDVYYDRQTLNKEAAFVLAKTATLIQNELDPADYFGYMKTAREFSPSEWCAWLNTNFQVLRNEAVKELYCSECRQAE